MIQDPAETRRAQFSQNLIEATAGKAVGLRV